MSKKEAELAYKNLIKPLSLNENLFVYTNRNEINKKVDASSITRTIISNFFLGSINLFTVYLEELYGILLRTGFASHMEYKASKTVIYMDNQDSICAIDNSSSKSS